MYLRVFKHAWIISNDNDKWVEVTGIEWELSIFSKSTFETYTAFISDRKAGTLAGQEKDIVLKRTAND